jgi:hypothetical protein
MPTNFYSVETIKRRGNCESGHAAEALDFIGVFVAFAFAKTPESGYNNPYFSRPLEFRVARLNAELKAGAKELTSRPHNYQS